MTKKEVCRNAVLFWPRKVKMPDGKSIAIPDQLVRRADMRERRDGTFPPPYVIDTDRPWEREFLKTQQNRVRDYDGDAPVNEESDARITRIIQRWKMLDGTQPPEADEKTESLPDMDDDEEET